MIEVGNSLGLEVWGNSKGGSSAGKYTECVESELEDGLQKTLGTAEVGPLVILFWCKGNCRLDLAKLARGPKSILFKYMNIR